jgi:hemolysin III
MAIIWTDENASQESVNAWTHGFGFMASLPAGILLCWAAAERSEQIFWACAAYSMSLSAMYLFSTLSHAVRDPEQRSRVRALDQGTIYTLIAGTFTPFACSALDGWLKPFFLTLVWLAAAAGFYSKVFAKHRLNNMTSVSYVLMGWIPSMVLLGYVPLACFGMMALGGVMYTIGTLFLQNDHRSWYFHAIWHVLVILASACHYAAIAIFVVFV